MANLIIHNTGSTSVNFSVTIAREYNSNPTPTPRKIPINAPTLAPLEKVLILARFPYI